MRLIKIDIIIKLDNEYKEFHANYMVFKKIDNSVSIEALQWRFMQLAPLIENLKNRKKEIIFNISSNPNLGLLKKNEYFTLYHYIILYTQDIFIFGEWDRLIDLFKEHNMIMFLYFLHLINEIFKEVADNNNDLDSMREDIINLGFIMDKIDYEKLIFENQFQEKDKLLLKEFRSSLKDKIN